MYALSFEALAIGHDEIGVGNGKALEDQGLGARRDGEVTGFHDSTRTCIANDGTTMLKLNDPSKELRGRCRFAVDQDDNFAGIGLLFGLRKLGFALIPSDAIGD